MPGPFHNAVKGTTAGAAGTGAFTPNAASSGFRAWSTVPSGWIGLVRFEDGTAWELSYCYWNGTTLSRGTNQRVDSSTGAVLSLTGAATAAMVADGWEIQSHLGGTPWSMYNSAPNATAPANVGYNGNPTATGTGAGVALAATNYLTMQKRIQYTSATTANAQAGWSTGAVGVVSTTAGQGGVEYQARFGPSQLPTGPRLFAGLTSTTFVGNTGEPSALVAHVAAFAKDSTDSNIQLLVNSNAGSGTKTDTGIALAANGWYEASTWIESGSTTVYGLLIRLDTGAIWFGSTSTDTPGNGALMLPNVIGGLSATTGTAFIMHIGSLCCRTGS